MIPKVYADYTVSTKSFKTSVRAWKAVNYRTLTWIVFANIQLWVVSLFLQFVYLVYKSTPEVFCKKGVLENFVKFTGKRLYWGLFFNKLQVESL